MRAECHYSAVIPGSGIRPFVVQSRCNIQQAQNIELHLLHDFAVFFVGVIAITLVP